MVFKLAKSGRWALLSLAPKQTQLSSIIIFVVTLDKLKHKLLLSCPWLLTSRQVVQKPGVIWNSSYANYENYDIMIIIILFYRVYSLVYYVVFSGAGCCRWWLSQQPGLCRLRYVVLSFCSLHFLKNYVLMSWNSTVFS